MRQTDIQNKGLNEKLICRGSPILIKIIVQFESILSLISKLWLFQQWRKLLIRYSNQQNLAAGHLQGGVQSQAGDAQQKDHCPCVDRHGHLRGCGHNRLWLHVHQKGKMDKENYLFRLKVLSPIFFSSKFIFHLQMTPIIRSLIIERRSWKLNTKLFPRSHLP